MLSNNGLPYVGRFACGWLRLATTDLGCLHSAWYAHLRGVRITFMNERAYTAVKSDTTGVDKPWGMGQRHADGHPI